MNNPKFKIPGVFWSALLIAAAALIQANFEHAAWYQLAMLVLAGILKGMDVGFNKVIEDITLNPGVDEDDPANISFSRSLPMADEDAPYLTATLEVTEEDPSALARWFLG